MGILSLILGLSLVGLTVPVQGQMASRSGQGGGLPQAAKAEELFALANESRVQAGFGKLEWDPELAAAALKHCLRMAAEGPISHQYGGEADLTTRAGEAGARFSLIEENIAVGPFPATIHQGWLNSPPHRANLLSRDVDHVGIAVVLAQGVLFAVEDFSRATPQLRQAEIEGKIAGLLRTASVTVRRDATDARAACALDRGLPKLVSPDQPQFVVRWQDSDLSHLPANLSASLSSGRYKQAEVGSCAPRNVEGAFTIYRVAVLLY
jgi:hypothetical protein